MSNTLKDHVGSGRTVKFRHYCQGNLWYTCDSGFEFPVPIEDAGTGVFKSEDKAILYMRYVRKHMELLAKAREEAGIK